MDLDVHDAYAFHTDGPMPRCELMPFTFLFWISRKQSLFDSSFLFGELPDVLEQ